MHTDGAAIDLSMVISFLASALTWLPTVNSILQAVAFLVAITLGAARLAILFGFWKRPPFRGRRDWDSPDR